MLSDADREKLTVKVEKEVYRQLRWARILGWLLIALGIPLAIALIGFVFIAS